MSDPAKPPTSSGASPAPARLSDRPPLRTNRIAGREGGGSSTPGSETTVPNNGGGLRAGGGVTTGPTVFSHRITPSSAHADKLGCSGPLSSVTTPTIRALNGAPAASPPATGGAHVAGMSLREHERELAAAAERRRLRTQIDACLREQSSGAASIFDLVCRLCELLGGDHACLWSVPPLPPGAAATGAGRPWTRMHVVAEAVSDGYPLHNFTVSPPPPAWTEYYLEPVLENASAVRFQGYPPDAPDEAKWNPAAQSQFLAVALHGRPGQHWVLLLERFGAGPTPGAPPWADHYATLLDEFNVAFCLVLENHQLGAQSAERDSYLSNMLNSVDLAVMVIEQPRALGQPALVSLVNRGFCEIFNLDRAEVEGGNYLVLMERIRLLLPDPEGQLELLENLLADPAAEHADELVLTDPSTEGGQRTLHRYATPARDAAGRIFGRMFFFRDITYDKELERQLLHSQKMDSIGTLAGGVAHDFNNLLTTILGYTELLKRELKEDEPRKQKLLQIERSANRAAELTGQLLAFSRRHPTLLRVFDLNKLVEETMGMLRSTVPATIELATECYPKLPNIEADETQIQQVLINLVINARDALPGAGKITVSTRPGLDTQSSAATGTIYTILEVEDDGVGIPKDVLHRIFEPFYTTKEVGKGTGLGLSMVYGIIKKHNGFIEVTSALGVGTKFSVFLPSCAKPAELGNPLAGAPRAARKRDATLLIVDDEPDLREFCVAALGELCSHILTASNGVEAIEHFKAANGKIDLVLLDLTMPKMSGPECFQHLRALDPHVRILISSGYNLDFNERGSIAEQATGFLPKPYDLNQLVESVERALTSGDEVQGRDAEASQPPSSAPAETQPTAASSNAEPA
ncbi:MAG: response regulator [Verrucomicrobia bacterium]|nr:response regulator [Verrucomicrobiota bacterium]MBV9658507.1 response regulator [Verrucomicrobiota bacterium]